MKNHIRSCAPRIRGWFVVGALALYSMVSPAQIVNPVSGGGGGTGTVTAVNGTSPIVSDGSTTTPTISCPTCVTSTAVPASTLTGTTLASNVVSSSLTSAAGGTFGTAAYQNTGTSGATLGFLNGANTYSGASVFSANGAASTPALSITGTCYSAGTGTTNTPCILIQPAGTTAVTNWTTNLGGTKIGINAESSFTGNLLDFRVNGGQAFSVTNSGIVYANGNITMNSGFQFVWNGRSNFSSPSTGLIYVGTGGTAGTGGSMAMTNMTANAVLPGVLYSAAGTALPTCAVGIKGQQSTVSDATSPTYMGAYTSGGAITAAVICSYNGTTYAWLTH